MTFDPNKHMMQLKSKEGSKDYLPIAWRLVWFRELCPQGTIDSEELEYDLDREITVERDQWDNNARQWRKVQKTARGYARYKAIVTDGKGGRAVAHASESAVDFAEFGEKAETKAIGRALAMLGYGADFAGDELAEEHRIADSPVARNGR
jgi:hypothetical protein